MALEFGKIIGRVRQHSYTVADAELGHGRGP